MIEKEIFLAIELGLHARPSAKIANTLLTLNLALAELYYENLKADLRSVISLLNICVKKKSTVLIKLDGPDEQKALKVVEEVFKQKNFR
jgi:phosphocarrier protein HPr